MTNKIIFKKIKFINIDTKNFDKCIAKKGLFGNIGARYIPEFDWAAGVHFGKIESYFVLDGMLGYRFNDRYDLLFNVNNMNNDVHREIIGGPKLGRQFTLKFNAKF